MKHLKLFILFGFGSLFCLSLSAEGIDIHSAETYIENERYFLNADLSYHFSEEAIEALEHGVALHINIDIKTEKKRRFIWDKTMGKWTIQYRLEYHPLSQRYLLIELNRGIRQDFRSLSNALDSLGSIKAWPLLATNELEAGSIYESSLKASLDIQALPAPLRPIASVSNDWRLNTDGWFSWIMKS